MPLSSPVSLPPFDPHRFKSTANHYVRGRLAYPSDLIQRVAERVGIGREDRVLDLGCGPGFLAAAFRQHAGEVVGIDPEPEMLAVAERYALQSQVEVVFRQGSSYDLNPDLGLFRLTAMGRSFHWMDRAATLRSLDALTKSGGAVAIFRTHHPDVSENAWKIRFDDLLLPLREKDPARDIGRDTGLQGARHVGVLLQSSFSDLERISVIRRIVTPIDLLLDRALSQSISSPERLGADRDAFLDQLRRVLTEESPDGTITEIVETEALLAFRPEDR